MDWILNFFGTLPLLLFWSIFLGSIGVGVVLQMFPTWNLLDFPERYGLSREKLPYPAGIVIFICFCVGIGIFSWFFEFEYKKLLGFVLGLSLLVCVCFWDDRSPLSPLFRICVQIVASLCVILSGVWIKFVTNPFSPEAFELPYILGAFLTAIWILGFVNATNWTDGVPNLTLSSGIVSSITLGILSLHPLVNQPEMAFLCFLLAGICIPFLLVNLGKTRFVLGDSGSMMIGFCLAVFSLFSGGKMATILMVMSIPILDSVYVFISRILEKRSPLEGKDGLHLHDQLGKRNWTKVDIFLLYFGVSLLLGTAVLFLESIGKIALLLAVSLVFFVFRARMKIL